jgi:predicted  nucleic acid-binding Zn-ribbon protein
MRAALAARETADNEILSLREKLNRYKAQQLEVRNNREYDALTREIDHATETIARLEKEMEMLEGKAMTAKGDIAAVSEQIEQAQKLLEEKSAALQEIARMNEEEEAKYRHERDKLIARIDKAHLDAYQRIRKAKKGRAVVPVRRNACGGCFAKIPPQRLLELRQNDKVYNCEHCGRIIVSVEIAEATSTPA